MWLYVTGDQQAQVWTSADEQQDDDEHAVEVEEGALRLIGQNTISEDTFELN